MRWAAGLGVHALPFPFAFPFELIAMAVAFWASPAAAGDPFEIQVYDGTANAAGVAGVELHLNDWITGHRAATPPELPLHGQFHATLEPSFGLRPFWEVGAYLQMALRGDDGGAIDWAGVKLRSKFVTPPGWDAHWRLGVNFEVSYLPSAYDANRWGSEVRPIVAWQNREWLFAVNPIVDQSLAGSGSSEGPSLQPAAKAARTVGPVALGLEYYSTLGPLTALLPLRAQEHYLFEVVDLLSVDRFELNAGIGEGLTPASAGVIAKAIVGYAFDTVPPPLRQAAVFTPMKERRP
ncbi:MAG: hypothetical protein M3O50_08640 [Myxococcota bacterium]|nr:hypothetical protein [Myxococcota bacterium]